MYDGIETETAADSQNVAAVSYESLPLSGGSVAAWSDIEWQTEIPGDVAPQPLVWSILEKVTAVTLLLVLSPLFLLVAIALKIQGRGSVFYKQVRVGIDGQTFRIFKFRTMRVDAEKNGPFICKTYTDERITKVGAYLRKSKIDELPQLVNILKGEMSFVGPRPERPCFHQEFLGSIPNWQQRIRVKPGLTGLAQVSKIISHEPRLKIIADMTYINHRSVWLDLKILLFTALPKLLPTELEGVPLRRP